MIKHKMPSPLENYKAALYALKEENNILRRIVADLHWMARRYADGRSSYAVSLFNERVRQLVNLKIRLNPTADGKIFARDSMGEEYEGVSREEQTKLENKNALLGGHYEEVSDL